MSYRPRKDVDADTTERCRRRGGRLPHFWLDDNDKSHREDDLPTSEEDTVTYYHFHGKHHRSFGSAINYKNTSSKFPNQWFWLGQKIVDETP